MVCATTERKNVKIYLCNKNITKLSANANQVKTGTFEYIFLSVSKEQINGSGINQQKNKCFSLHYYFKGFF